MIRQARTYMVGAMSGATLIAIAIAVFAVLVSTQVFGDWPVGGLIGGGNDAAVSSATPVDAAVATPAGVEGVAGKAAAGGGGAATGGQAGGGGNNSQQAGGGTAKAPGGNGAGGGGGGEGTNPGGGGGSAPTGSPEGASGGSGTASGGGGGSGGSGGGGSEGGSTKPPTSAQVTGAVNETVNKVDEATGGVVGETGVTQTTEEVVNGVAGPESIVGHTVDEATGAVEGIAGGGH